MDVKSIAQASLAVEPEESSDYSVALMSISPDGEGHIVVNDDRTVSVPAELKEIAVQFDHNVETVTFDCPRYWDGHDFSEMHVYINYMCADKSKGQYLCENVRIDESDNNIIHFDWTIKRNVTCASGKIYFLVCVKKTDEAGNLLNHWCSRLNQEMKVLDGLECTSEEIVSENPDVIESILSRLDVIEQNGGSSGSGETYSTMTGATAETDGASGLVPAPMAGEQDKFLRGDGTWSKNVDDTLTISGAAADAKATGDQIRAIYDEIANQGGKTPLDTFLDNVDVDYAYDEATGAYYTVIRIYKQKLDGSYQYPFVYAPNGAGSGDKSTYDMTVEAGWLLAINSGIFNTSTKKPDGIVIQNGTVVQNASSATNSQCKPLTIDSNGDLSYAAYDVDAAELVAAGIVSAVCGFMPIVVDYAAVDSSEWNSVSHYTQNAQRQIIGQWGNGDYAIITCEGRGYHNSDGWTIAEAQAVCIRHGLKFAYNLDGGGSTETMLGHKPVNTIYENATGRVVPTFIVFSGATVPPAADETGGSGDEETEVTLMGISATYTGGDVAVGTAVTELIGIVVTANYSDGSTATVTEYTLSGEIAEGENTVTVTYAGLTTTFTVVGVAESGFEPVTANAVYLIGYSNVDNGNGWSLDNLSSRIAAVTTEPNIEGQQAVTVNGVNYYTIPVPRSATKVIVTCPGFIPGDRYWSYDAYAKAYTSLLDPGWQSEGGVTREFEAGTYAYMTVNFKNSGNSTIPADTDTSGFSIVFE
jgi:hypothetical protein